MSVRSVVLAIATGAAVAAGGAAAAAESVWITDSRLASALLRVDVATGERSVVDLEDYPLVIDVGPGLVAASGQLYLAAENAAQGDTIIRYDPGSGQTVGISGFVDRTSDVPRGAGPDFEPGLVGTEVGPLGLLYVLRLNAGPMSVDLATGDRAVVSQSAAPAVGEGVELLDPEDMVVEQSGSLLVADRFGGLVRVAAADGARTVAHTFTDLVEAAHRIGRLPDGRVVHAFGAGDGRAVTVLDRSLRVASELSGPSRGSGPELLGIADLSVAADGTVYVLDLWAGALLAVDPATGDRRVVTDDRYVGEDDVRLGTLSPGARLLDAEVPRVPPSPRAASGRVAGPGPRAD